MVKAMFSSRDNLIQFTSAHDSRIYDSEIYRNIKYSEHGKTAQVKSISQLILIMVLSKAGENFTDLKFILNFSLTNLNTFQ